MERIVIETTAETKQKLRELSYRKNRTMKQLLGEAIELLLKKEK